MKTKTKKHKLLALITVFFMTGLSLCVTSYEMGSLSINDVKNKLKSLSLKEEKIVAKQIVVKNDGIKFKDDFIPKTNGFKVITVRLTVYWAKGGGTDYYSSKKKSSTGYTLKQGESIAVDPKIIPYRKEVIIPNIGLVKAVDTGSAVVAKSASHGKLPVIDVFFEHKKDAMLFANRYPKVVKVAILN
jgi:3D (Asp-Asp-Asp) domain-containing protein/lambda repressor-like predicted transcriptional regulator